MSWRVRGVSSVLAVLLCTAVGTAARADEAHKVLREVERWGDGRFVAGDVIRSKSFSSGRLAVAVSRGVLVWDVGTLAEVAHIPLPFDPRNHVLHEVVLSPDGRRVTIGSAGGAGVWELRSGKRLFDVSWKDYREPGVALAPSGLLAAVWEKPSATTSVQPARVELWDLRRKTSRPLPAGSPIWELKFLDDDRWLLPLEIEYHFTAPPFVISRSADGAASIREPASAPCRTVKTGPCTLTVPGGRWTVEVASQPYESKLGVGSERPRPPFVSVTDHGKNRLVIAETHPSSSYKFCSGDVCDAIPTNIETARVALDRRGNRLATILSQMAGGQRLEVWDLPAQRKIANAPIRGGVYDFALSPSGAWIVVHEAGGTAWKTRHDLVVFAADKDEPVWRQDDIPWGDAHNASEVWIVEPAGLVTLLEQPHGLAPVRAVAWDIETGAQRFALPIGRGAHGRPLAARAHLALPASTNGFAIVATRAGADAWPSDRHAGAVTRLALSDDGALLASAGDDSKVIVRSLAGRPAARVVTADATDDLGFSPGSHQLLAAAGLAATRWDGDTGAPRGEVRATLDDGAGHQLVGARLFPARDAVGFFREYNSGLELRPWQADKPVRTLTKFCPRLYWRDGISLAGRGWCGSIDDDNRFVLRELEGGAVGQRADGAAGTSRWMIARDGRHVLYTENGVGGVMLATTDGSETPARIHERRSTLTAAAFTPDARLAFTALWEDERVHVWDVKTKTEIDSVDLSATLDHATALATSNRGDELFVGTARGVVYRFSISIPAR